MHWEHLSHLKRADGKLYTFGPNGQGLSDCSGCWLDDLEPRNDPSQGRAGWWSRDPSSFSYWSQEGQSAGGGCNVWTSWVRVFLARSRLCSKKLPFHQLAGRIQGPRRLFLCSLWYGLARLVEGGWWQGSHALISGMWCFLMLLLLPDFFVDIFQTVCVAGRMCSRGEITSHCNLGKWPSTNHLNRTWHSTFTLDTIFFSALASFEVNLWAIQYKEEVKRLDLLHRLQRNQPAAIEFLISKELTKLSQPRSKIGPRHLESFRVAK